ARCAGWPTAASTSSPFREVSSGVRPPNPADLELPAWTGAQYRLENHDRSSGAARGAGQESSSWRATWQASIPQAHHRLCSRKSYEPRRPPDPRIVGAVVVTTSASLTRKFATVNPR